MICIAQYVDARIVCGVREQGILQLAWDCLPYIQLFLHSNVKVDALLTVNPLRACGNVQILKKHENYSYYLNTLR